MAFSSGVQDLHAYHHGSDKEEQDRVLVLVDGRRESWGKGEEEKNAFVDVFIQDFDQILSSLEKRTRKTLLNIMMQCDHWARYTEFYSVYRGPA